MTEIGQKRYIDDQKVQVVDESKRDICKYLVYSDVMMLDIIMCITFLPVQNK